MKAFIITLLLFSILFNGCGSSNSDSDAENNTSSSATSSSSVASSSSLVGTDLEAPYNISATTSSKDINLTWDRVAQALSYKVQRCAIKEGIVDDICRKDAQINCSELGATHIPSYTDVPADNKAYCYSVASCQTVDNAVCGKFSASIPAALRTIKQKSHAIIADGERTAFSGQEVTLYGYASKSSTETRFEWKQISGTKVTIKKPTSATATFVAPILSSHEHELLTFKLKVSDDKGEGESAKVAFDIEPTNNVQVEVLNNNRIVQPNHQVSLHAFAQGATDASFSWRQISPSTPQITLQNADTNNPTFVAPNVHHQTFSFEVVYTDTNSGAFATAIAKVVVEEPSTTVTSQPLIVNSQVVPQHLRLQLPVVAPAISGTKVRLAIGVTGGEGSYSYNWAQLKGTPVNLNGSTLSSPSFTVPALSHPETLSFNVIVTDGAANTSYSVLRVNVYPNQVSSSSSSSSSTPASSSSTPASSSSSSSAIPIEKQLPTIHAQAGDLKTLSTTLTNPHWVQILGTTASINGENTGTLTVGIPNIMSSAEILMFQVTGIDTNSQYGQGAQTVKLIYPVAVIRPPSIQPPLQVPPVVAPPVTTPPSLIPGLNPPLDLQSIGIDRADEGQHGVVLGVQASGGSGHYSYSWSYDKNSSGVDITLRDATTSHPQFDAPSVNAKKILRFEVTVNDGSTTKTIPVFIYINDLSSTLHVGSLAPMTVNSGDFIALSAPAPQGGVPPYSFTVTQTSGQSVGSLTGANPAFPAPVLAAGSSDKLLTFEFSVTDGYGNTAKVDQNVTVKAPPPPLRATLTGPSEADASTNIHLNTNIVNGTAPYTYSYTLTPAAFSIPASANPAVTLPAVTTDTKVSIVMHVTDSTTPAQNVDAQAYSLTVKAPKPSASASKYVGASQCLVCGSEATDTPCSTMELVLANETQCPDAKPYCMNDIYQDGMKVRHFRRCVDEPTCETLWFNGSSDKSYCTQFDASVPAQQLACHICCFLDVRITSGGGITASGGMCNMNDVPPVPTQFHY